MPHLLFIVKITGFQGATTEEISRHGNFIGSHGEPFCGLLQTHKSRPHGHGTKCWECRLIPSDSERPGDLFSVLTHAINKCCHEKCRTCFLALYSNFKWSLRSVLVTGLNNRYLTTFNECCVGGSYSKHCLKIFRRVPC